MTERLSRAALVVGVATTTLAASAWAQHSDADPVTPAATSSASAPAASAPPRSSAPPPGYGYPYPYWYYYPGYYPPPPGATSGRVVAAPPGVPKKRRNKGMMVGGILMASGGAVAAIAGSALIGVADDRFDVYCESETGGPFLCTKRNDTTMMTGGAIMTIVGGLGIVVGIPLWVIGGKMVPVEKEERPTPVRVVLHTGPGGLGLSGSF